MKGIPLRLQHSRNDHELILDRFNVAHVLRTDERAACGSAGTVATLAQAIAWGTAWCGHASCYAVGQRGRTVR